VLAENMAELKTKQTDQSVEAFLNGIADENRRQDCFTILEIMKQITGTEPKMCGETASLVLAAITIRTKADVKATGS
jgi:hypothetical protein